MALIWTSVLILGGLSAGAQPKGFTPVTDAMLQNPSPADWLNWRRTLDAWGFSPLDQINTKNAHQLQLVWSGVVGAGVSEPTPLVYDGVMYLAHPAGVVQALDAVTGDVIWDYTKTFETTTHVFPPRTRSLAIYGENIYVATADAHIVALERADRRGGLGSYCRGLQARLSVYERTDRREGEDCRRHDRLRTLQERRVLHLGARCRTGTELWRTTTIARPGEPGGETWGDLPLMFRAGGDAWIPGSYDPRTELDLLVGRAGQAMGARVAGHRRRRAVHQQHAGPRPRQRQDDVVPPVSSGRDSRHGRSVREHAHRPGGPPFALQDGQARHPLGARSPDGRFVGARDLGYQDVVEVDPARAKPRTGRE